MKYIILDLITYIVDSLTRVIISLELIYNVMILFTVLELGGGVRRGAELFYFFFLRTPTIIFYWDRGTAQTDALNIF